MVPYSFFTLFRLMNWSWDEKIASAPPVFIWIDDYFREIYYSDASTNDRCADNYEIFALMW